VLLLCLTAFFWAGNFVIGRAVAFTIPPVALACLRWILAFLVFLPFAWPHLRRDWRTIAAHWPILLFLSLLGPGSFNTLSYIGLAYTEALNALLFNAAGPVFIAGAASLIFGDRLGGRQVAGMAAALAGVLIVLTKGRLGALASLRLNEGDLLMLIAMTTWGVYTAFLRKRPGIAWQSFSAVTFGIAGLANFPFAIIEHETGRTLTLDAASIAAIAYVAIFPSLIAYIFYNRGVELLGAAKAGMYLFLVPVFGALLAMVFLGEDLTLAHLAAFALIIAGVKLGAGSRASPAPVNRPA
jgi:drug/metabolite transporter (DMT)-like permease